MRAVKPVVCSHWASVGVCENVQVCKEQCFGYSWQRCSTASGWEQGGLACRRALLGMFYSSSGHSASPAQRGSILLPAPKQKLLKCQESVSLQFKQFGSEARSESVLHYIRLTSLTAVQHVRVACRDNPELAPSYSLPAFPPEQGGAQCRLAV